MNLFMERMTWEEIRDAMRAGRKNALLMLGSIEQHGPHLPLNTDTLAAYSEAEKICSQLPDYLIAPIISLGCSSHHMGFPGTVTLSWETFTAVVEEVCISLDHHGFQRIAIVPTHGGNIPPIQKHLDRMREKIDAEVNFVTIDNFDELVDTVVREDLGGKLKVELHSCHACLHETSFMLAEFPDAVRKNKIVPGRTTKFDGKMLVNGGDTKALSANGILGDPTLASAALGKIIEDVIIAEDVKRIRQL